MPDVQFGPGSIVIGVVLAVGVIVTDIWALLDNLRQSETPTLKTAWTVIVLCLPILGPLFYLIFGHIPRQRAKRSRM